MQLRTGRYGPFYTSTHECGETKPFAQRVGVLCPQDGGDVLEKRSKKGKLFYPCGNWPECDWVSFYRPLTEPCPDDGGLQVDMGRGRTRCLKHEGPPPRFAAREKANGAGDAEADGDANGTTRPKTRATKSAKTTRATRSRPTTGAARVVKAVKRATAKTPAKNGTATARNGKVASPRRTVAKKA